MKTKETWVQEYLAKIKQDQGLVETADRLSFVAAIQLDAKRAAYAECAEISRTLNDGHDWPVTRAIEIARDNLKLP